MIRTALLSAGFLAAFLQGTRGQSPAGEPEIVLQTGHTTPIWALAVSADSRFVASAAVDRTIKIWSLSDGRLLRTLDGTHGIEALAFSPDGRVLASADDGRIALFDVRTGSTIRRIAACDDVIALRVSGDIGFGEPSRVIALAFNPSGRFLASACDGDASVKAWDFATGREIRRFGGPPPGAPTANAGKGRTVRVEGHAAGFGSIAFDSSGRRLAAGSADHTVRVWEFTTGKETLTLRGHSRSVRTLGFTRDDRFITGSDGQMSIAWANPAGTTVETRPAPWAAFDAEGRWLLHDINGNVTASAIGVPGRSQPAGTLPLSPLSLLSPDGRWLIGIDDKKVLALNLADGATRRLLDVVVAERRMVASHDGTLLALQPRYSNSPGLSLKLWNLKTNDIRTLSGPAASRAVFSRDDRVLAAATDDKKVRVWESESATEVHAFDVDNAVHSVSLNPTGGVLAASGHNSGNGHTRVWDVARNLPLSGYTGGWAQFSPDGRWIAYSVVQSIRIVDAATGEVARTLSGMRPMAFSTDSRLLAGMTDYTTVRIWDVSKSGLVVRTLSNYHASAMTFSPNRRWFALQDDNDDVFLWDLERAGNARRFSGYSIGFTAGGALLWTSRADGITRFWTARGGALVASLAMIEATDDWAVTTPDGQFDGTPQGIRQLLVWRSGDRLLPSDQFIQRRVPGLLARLLTQ